MFFKRESESDVSVETKMVMTFIFALAVKLKIKPKDLAKAAVSDEVMNYLPEFTKEFAVASVDAMVAKKKAHAKKK